MLNCFNVFEKLNIERQAHQVDNVYYTKLKYHHTKNKQKNINGSSSCRDLVQHRQLSYLLGAVCVVAMPKHTKKHQT